MAFRIDSVEGIARLAEACEYFIEASDKMDELVRDRELGVALIDHISRRNNRLADYINRVIVFEEDLGRAYGLTDEDIAFVQWRGAQSTIDTEG